MREILNRLMSVPLRGQIQINFSIKKGSFLLSLPIFSTPGALPKGIRGYVEARKDKVFLPHKTRFKEEAGKVLLEQELPFSGASLREEADHFWHMGQKMHRMFYEMAIEEKYKCALRLDSDSF